MIKSGVGARNSLLGIVSLFCAVAGVGLAAATWLLYSGLCLFMALGVSFIGTLCSLFGFAESRENRRLCAWCAVVNVIVFVAMAVNLN
jgi:hypothetical protein